MRETSWSNHFEALTPSVSSHTPIVGRQHELTLLMNYYEATRERRTHVALLVGEPGIGKTRLLNEVALQAAQEGATILYGNASEDKGTPPFLPFLEAIGRYIHATSPDQLRRQLSTISPILANLFPELAIYLPNFLSVPVPPEQGHLRLYEAIGFFLRAICEERTLVFILDNLQWADTASLDLLQHLAYYQAYTRIFILGAYREGDGNRNPALIHTLAKLSHQRILSTITLHPLSEVEIGLLALGRHGNPLSPEANALLYRQSEGNPFFVEELLDEWIIGGTLTLQDQQWVAMTLFVSTLPPTIVGALHLRFAHLAPAVVDHLRVAAVIGRSFELPLLAAIEEQEEEAIEEDLFEAVQARLLQIDQLGHYIFSHDKIREYLYTEVSISRRRRLQGLIGRALEATARRVAVENLSIHGHDLPIRIQFLETELAQIEERGDLTETSECCRNLAVAYYWSGKIKRSYEVSLQRITFIERSQQLYQLHTASIWPIILLTSQGKWTEAKRQIEKVRPMVDSSPSPISYAFLHQFQGFLAYQQEQYALAEYEVQTATTFAQQSVQSGPGEIMFYIGLQSLIQATVGKREEASASLANLEQLLKGIPDGTLPTAPMKLCLALSSISLMQYPQSGPKGEESGDWPSRTLQVQELYAAKPKMSSGSALALDNYERAKSLYTPLLAFRGQYYWFLVDRVLGLLAILNQDWEAATTHLAEAEVIARREELYPELARTLVGKADIALGRGGKENIQQAIHLLNEAHLLFESLEMEASAHHTSQRLSTLSHHHQDTTDPSLSAGLTPREVEVLKLVACGRSNSEIAQELVISEKTAINHLTHIFNKTNSRNRAAATAFAIHHGLA